MLHHEEQRLITEENAAFRLAAMSVIGDRNEQQDSVGFSLEAEGGLVVICDGMGGHDGGRAASELAVETLVAGYAGRHPQAAPVDVLIEAARTADDRIARLTDENGERMKAGSTFVSIAVDRRRLTWCSAGDSRAYLLRNGEMVQLTQDHNYHTVLVEKRNAGLLDEETFRREDVRGEALISFLGIGDLALMDYSATPLELVADDKILLMSDGLYRVVTDEEIARILDNFSNIGEAVQALEMKAKKNARYGGEDRDNTTIVLVKIK